MLKTTVAAAAIAIAIAIAAPTQAAGLFNGAQLYEWCSAPTLEKQRACVTYLAGVRDAYETVIAWQHGKPISCMYDATDATGNRMRSVYMRFMADHGDFFAAPAARGAMEAFATACASNS
jgi:hypothetical protein